MGGARSGKSGFAERAALDASRELDRAVSVIVTAEALDDEMELRIARHRADRPDGFATVEAPYDLETALGVVDDDVVVIDCLTVWISNCLVRGDTNEDVEAAAHSLVELVVTRASPTILVSNEVGMGIVPANDLARRFRDVQGRVNATLADGVERALLIVAGKAIPLMSTEDVWRS